MRGSQNTSPLAKETRWNHAAAYEFPRPPPAHVPLPSQTSTQLRLIILLGKTMNDKKRLFTRLSLGILIGGVLIPAMVSIHFGVSGSPIVIGVLLTMASFAGILAILSWSAGCSKVVIAILVCLAVFFQTQKYRFHQAVDKEELSTRSRLEELKRQNDPGRK